MKLNKVIIAVGLEAENHCPLVKIKDLDINLKAEIHLVHVVPVIIYGRGLHSSVLTYPLPEERAAISAEIIARLAEFKQEIFPEHKNVTCKCLFNSNEKLAFSDYAREQEADLIIVASRTSHGFANFFDSSFTQYVLKHSLINVLVLK